MGTIASKKILLVWIGRLGDLVVSTPFINALKKKYPNSKITLLIKNKVYDVAKMILSVDEIIILPIPVEPKSYFTFIKRILLDKYDICVDMNSSYSRTSGILTKLSRAPIKVSFEKPRAKLFYTHTIAKPSEKEHMLLKFGRLAKFFETEYIPEMTLDINETHRMKAKKILANLGIRRDSFKLLIHPGNFKKYDLRWPKKKFVAISRKISELPDVQQIYLAGPGEEKQVKKMLQHLPPSVKYLPPMRITLTCAILKEIDLLIVCGTGTMHLGATMQTPMLTILSQYAYECWRPLNENAVSLTTGDWKTCRTMKPEKVWAEFLKIYQKWKSNPQ